MPDPIYKIMHPILSHKSTAPTSELGFCKFEFFSQNIKNFLDHRLNVEVQVPRTQGNTFEYFDL
ncbi:hypothetical protein STEG23_017403, partial [Scotinomys teguina]